jgi:hypothetical protein
MAAGPHDPGFHPMGILETDAVTPLQKEENPFSDKVLVDCVVC